MVDPENKSEVTAIALSPDRKHIAAGLIILQLKESLKI